MGNFSLLLLVLLPLAGAVIGAVLMPTAAMSRIWALVVSLATLGTACMLVGHNAEWGTDATGQPLISVASILNFSLSLRCDGLSIWLVLLCTFVTPLVILAADEQIKNGGKWFYCWVLVLLGALLGAFTAADALLFYVFFELTLVPSLFFIVVWGGPDRRQAAGKFFIYTFAGSIFLLVSILYIALRSNSLSIDDMVRTMRLPGTFSATERGWLALGLMIGFLIKTPIFPLHTWQPQTYSQAPMAGTVLIAALMSKLGTYGLLRIVLPMGLIVPPGTGSAQNFVSMVTQFIAALALIGIIYGGLIAWVQKDGAKLLAYSSLSHMGVCVLAILGQQMISVQGAAFYMLAHGISTAGLFLTLGMIQSRTGTRNLYSMTGLFKTMPVLSTLFILFTLSSVGLPLTVGFVGEFVSLQGLFLSPVIGPKIGMLACSGIVLGAIYMLHMAAKMFFGPPVAPEGSTVRDVTFSETLALVPLAVLVLVLGVKSTPIMESLKDPLSKIIATTDTRTAEMDRVVKMVD